MSFPPHGWGASLTSTKPARVALREVSFHHGCELTPPERRAWLLPTVLEHGSLHGDGAVAGTQDHCGGVAVDGRLAWLQGRGVLPSA